jgi:hypothetical protein
MSKNLLARGSCRSSYIQICILAVDTDAYSGKISYAMLWKFTKVIPEKEEE